MFEQIKSLLIRAILFCGIVHPLTVFSQAGTEFWLTIPELTETHGVEWGSGGLVKHVVVSTLESPATVTATVPAMPSFPPIEIKVPANTTERISFEAFNDLLELIEYDSVTKQGVLIESSDLITAYLESMEVYNPDIFTLKGRHSLGTDFYVPFQDKLYNNEMAIQPYSTIDILATEDGTEITVTPTDSVAKRGGGSYLPGETITVTLNKGETYSVRAFNFTAEGHLGGSHITSNRPIAVMIKDDSVYLGGGFDLNGDQMVPVSRTGSQYIIMKGGVMAQSMGDADEYAFIVPTEDNTAITVNGLELGTYNAGEQVDIPITEDYTVIQSDDKRMYCYHFVSAKGETGGALLPPTDQCSGSTRTGFSYSYGEPDPNDPNAGQQLYIMIMVRAGAENDFLVDGAVADWLDPTEFQQVSTFWSAAKFGPINNTILEEGPHLITNSTDLFHTGYINTTGSGVLYGYFSDFESMEVEALAAKTNESIATFCRGEEIRLRVDGGVSYSWRGFDPDSPSDDYSSFIINPDRYNPTISSTIPDGSYAFEVTVGNACGGATVKDTVLLNLKPKPDPQLVSAEFCESEIGSNCVTGKDLTGYVSALGGPDATMEDISWETEVYDEMYMYSDFDNSKSLSIKSVKVGTIEKSKEIAVKDGKNSSDYALYFTSTGKEASVSLTPIMGPGFDLSKGAIFRLKAFIDVWQSQNRTGTRTVTLSLSDGLTTIEQTETVSSLGSWQNIEFDFSAINTTDEFTSAILSFSGIPADNSDYYYVDDISKFITQRTEQILFPDSASFCGNAELLVTLENEEGCQIISTLQTTIGPGSFDIANSTVDAEFCESEVGSNCTEIADLTPYADEIIGTYTGISAVKWEKEVYDAMHVYESFEGENALVFSGETFNTLEYPYTNPSQSDANPSGKVLYYKISGSGGNLSFSSLTSEGFDFSTGDLFAFNVYLDRGTNSCNPTTFTLHFFNEGQDDTVSVSQTLDICNQWTLLSFDYSSLGSEKVYEKALLKETHPEWADYHYYFDNFQKYVDFRVAEITDPASTKLCGTPKIFVELENDEGCKLMSTINATISPGDFPINSPAEAVICQSPDPTEVVNTIDLTKYEADLLGSDGIANGYTVTKWEGYIVDSAQIIMDFDGTSLAVDTWRQLSANPDPSGVNLSSTAWQVGRGTSSLELKKPMSLTDGNIFTVDAYMIAGEWGSDDFSFTMELQTGDGTVLSSSTGTITYLHDDDSVWRHMEFDFSAYETTENIIQIDLTIAGENSYYIDNFQRTYAPIRSVFDEPAAAKAYDGATFYATIKNDQGCVVSGELNVSMKVCGPPVTDTTIIVCEDVKDGASAAGIDITPYETVMKSHIDANTVEWFSDKDLSLTVADPTAVTASDGDIIYAKVTNSSAIFDTARLTIEVRGLPELTFPVIDPVCIAEDTIDISLAEPMGGVYSSESEYFNNDSLFATLADGSYTVRYTYTDSIGCVDSIDQSVTVNPLPEIVLLTTDFDYCTVSDVDLEIEDETDATYAWYKDGTEQTGETGNILSGATEGYYTAKKTVKGCTASMDSIQVRGYGTPPYKYIGADTVCYGNSSGELGIVITGIPPLTLIYEDQDGTETTETINDTLYTIPFTETDPGDYSYTVTSITDSVGCPADITGESLLFSILPAATRPWVADTDTSFCENEAAADLTSYVTFPDGTFTGTGVDGTHFDPTIASGGAHYVYYSYEFEGICTAFDSLLMDVHALPVPEFDFDTAVCVTEPAYNLMIVSNDSITIESFSGTGVSSDQFDPAIGDGNYTISYEFESVHGCQSSAEVGITVHPLPQPQIGAEDALTFCISDAAFTIPVSPAGGTLSGTGVDNTTGEFTPSIAGQGSHRIDYYVLDENGCENTDTANYTVLFTEPIASKRFTFVETSIEPTISVTATDGADVTWYDAETGGTAIHTGTLYTHGETAVVEKSYWVAQSIDGCESERTEIHLSIIDCGTPAPIVADPNRTTCLYSNKESFTAQTVTPDAEVRWYDSDNNLLFTGKTYTAEVTDNFSFYAVQDTGCQSMAIDLSVTFTKPLEPVLQHSGNICEGTGTVSIQENSGHTTVYWFESEPAYPADITGLTDSKSFTSSATASGNHTVWAVGETDGCLSTASDITFTIKPVPAEPALTGNWSCFGANATDLSAIGTDVIWYTDATTTTQLIADNTYTPTETMADTYTYYASQTVDGCESPRASVEYEIRTLPAKPRVSDETICSNFDLPIITATADYTDIMWYKTADLATVYKTGATIQLQDGDTQLFVTQFGNGCESEASEFNLTIIPQPDRPTVSDKTVCATDTDAELNAATTVFWYADTTASLLASASALSISNLQLGDVEYYAQVEADGCYSYFSTATLTVVPQPDVPAIGDNSLESCLGESISTFSATPDADKTIHWFSTADNTKLTTGGNFDPTDYLDAGETVEFYAKQAIGDCFSDATSNVSYLLRQLPDEPEIDFAVFCMDDFPKNLTATADAGTTIEWLDIFGDVDETGPTYDISMYAPSAMIYTAKAQAKDSYGCRSGVAEKDIMIGAVPAPVIDGPDGICAFEDGVVFTINNRVDSTTVIEWSTKQLGGLTALATQKDSVLNMVWEEEGEDMITIVETTSLGCMGETSKEIYVSPKPDADFKYRTEDETVFLQNTSDYKNEDADLPYAESLANWTVEPEDDEIFYFDYQDSAIGQNFSFDIAQGDHQVSLTITNQYGCTDEVSKEVAVRIISNLYIPSAMVIGHSSEAVATFMPMGRNLKEYTCHIYDAWGNTIWFSDALIDGKPAYGWDGTIKGKPVTAGTYTWKIEATDKNGKEWQGVEMEHGKKRKFGSIMVIR